MIVLFNNNSDNQEFIKKLELLRDLEAEKPVEEMDVSLVMACVELILELRGETVNFTPEEVEEKVRKIPFVEETTTLNTPPQSVKGRSTKVKSNKILLIAAIIAITIARYTSTPCDKKILLNQSVPTSPKSDFVKTKLTRAKEMPLSPICELQKPRTPVPKVVRTRPVTFWLERRVTVKKE